MAGADAHDLEHQPLALPNRFNRAYLVEKLDKVLRVSCVVYLAKTVHRFFHRYAPCGSSGRLPNALLSGARQRSALTSRRLELGLGPSVGALQRESSFRTIGRMIHSVVGWHRPDVERVHALKTANVITILVRIRPSLMVCVDAAMRTEVMFGRHRIELVQLQGFFPQDYAYS